AELFLDRGAARVLKRSADFGVSGNRPAHAGRVADLFTPDARYAGVYLPLHGAYQADNAAAALAAADSFLERPLPEDVVTEAFGTVRSPGRLEVLGHAPLVLLDGAHNVAGAEERRRTLVIGLLREKEPHEMLEALDAEHVAHLLCSRPPSPRALDPARVAAAGADLGVDPARIETFDSVGDAVTRAREVTADDAQIVVTGSLYTVGAARQVLVHPSAGGALH